MLGNGGAVRDATAGAAGNAIARNASLRVPAGSRRRVRPTAMPPKVAATRAGPGTGHDAEMSCTVRRSVGSCGARTRTRNAAWTIARRGEPTGSVNRRSFCRRTAMVPGGAGRVEAARGLRCVVWRTRPHRADCGVTQTKGARDAACRRVHVLLRARVAASDSPSAPGFFDDAIRVRQIPKSKLRSTDKLCMLRTTRRRCFDALRIGVKRRGIRLK